LTFGYTFSIAKYLAGASLSTAFNSVSKDVIVGNPMYSRKIFGLNIILARRALEEMHQVIHLVSLSTFLNDLKKIM
jgi:hypothetical protein